MREYLIRPQNGHDWMPVDVSDVGRVLVPAGWDGEVVMTSDYRARVDGVEVSFSDEAVGWQVSFDGPVDPLRADIMIDTVAKQLARYSGIATTWVLLTA